MLVGDCAMSFFYCTSLINLLVEDSVWQLINLLVEDSMANNMIASTLPMGILLAMSKFSLEEWILSENYASLPNSFTIENVETGLLFMVIITWIFSEIMFVCQIVYL